MPQDFAWFPHNRARKRSIQFAWERFLADGCVEAAGVRGVVLQSWARCRQAAVEPQRVAAPLAARGEDLERLRQRNRELLRAAAAPLAAIHQSLQGTESIGLLADPGGIVIETVGSDRIKYRAASANITPGSDWSEAGSGTSAVGTALYTGYDVQIHAREHYCESAKDWTCSAALIRDPLDAAVCGVFDLSGDERTHHPHNLTLAVAVAKAIEEALRRRHWEREAWLMEQCLDRRGEGSGDGVVLLDHKGRILHCNRQAPAALARHGVCPRDLRRGATLADLEALLDGSGHHRTAGGTRSVALLRREWVRPLRRDGELAGAMLHLPMAGVRGAGGGRRVSHPSLAPPEADRDRDPFGRLKGNSAALGRAVAQARRVAASEATVLLLGETGTGKEILARAIHAASPRRNGRFVALNCGAVPPDLMASELFGYVDGAFTGARRSGAAGKFEQAAGGTLFLDEIAEMPFHLQVHLLRVLETRQVARLGDAAERPVDVRVIAATNQDLEQAVRSGRFRADLYYRLNVVAITLPPLRDRAGDVRPLLDEFLQHYARQYGRPLPRVTPAAMAVLHRHAWPGNVRELRNLAEQMVLLADGLVAVEDVPPALRAAAGPPAARAAAGPPAARAAAGPPAPDVPVPGSPAPAPGFGAGPGFAPGPTPELAPGRLPGSLDAAERQAILAACTESAGNLTRAARKLGIARSTLYRKLQAYGIDGRGGG